MRTTENLLTTVHQAAFNYLQLQFRKLTNTQTILEQFDDKIAPQLLYIQIEDAEKSRLVAACKIAMCIETLNEQRESIGVDSADEKALLSIIKIICETNESPHAGAPHFLPSILQELQHTDSTGSYFSKYVAEAIQVVLLEVGVFDPTHYENQAYPDEDITPDQKVAWCAPEMLDITAVADGQEKYTIREEFKLLEGVAFYSLENLARNIRIIMLELDVALMAAKNLSEALYPYPGDTPPLAADAAAPPFREPCEGLLLILKSIQRNIEPLTKINDAMHSSVQAPLKKALEETKTIIEKLNGTLQETSTLNHHREVLGSMLVSFSQSITQLGKQLASISKLEKKIKTLPTEESVAATPDAASFTTPLEVEEPHSTNTPSTITLTPQQISELKEKIKPSDFEFENDGIVIDGKLYAVRKNFSITGAEGTTRQLVRYSDGKIFSEKILQNTRIGFENRAQRIIPLVADALKRECVVTPTGDPVSPWIVLTPWVAPHSGKKLSEALEEIKRKPFSERLTLMMSLVKEIELLRAHNLIHNDITPDNIIFNPENDTLHLTDFGLTTQGYEPILSGHGSPKYWYRDSAQNPLQQEKHVGVDLYAFKLIFAECFPESFEMNTAERDDHLDHGSIRLPIPSKKEGGNRNVFAIYDLLDCINKPAGENDDSKAARKAISEKIAEIIQVFFKNSQLGMEVSEKTLEKIRSFSEAMRSTGDAGTTHNLESVLTQLNEIHGELSRIDVAHYRIHYDEPSLQYKTSHYPAHHFSSTETHIYAQDIRFVVKQAKEAINALSAMLSAITAEEKAKCGGLIPEAEKQINDLRSSIQKIQKEKTYDAFDECITSTIVANILLERTYKILQWPLPALSSSSDVAEPSPVTPPVTSPEADAQTIASHSSTEANSLGSGSSRSIGSSGDEEVIFEDRAPEASVTHRKISRKRESVNYDEPSLLTPEEREKLRRIAPQYQFGSVHIDENGERYAIASDGHRRPQEEGKGYRTEGTQSEVKPWIRLSDEAIFAGARIKPQRDDGVYQQTISALEHAKIAYAALQQECHVIDRKKEKGGRSVVILTPWVGDLSSPRELESILKDEGLARQPSKNRIDQMKSLMEQILAIAAAGIIHKDISPFNVMLDKDDKLRLIDFGVCSRVSDEPGAIIGHHDYHYRPDPHLDQKDNRYICAPPFTDQHVGVDLHAFKLLWIKMFPDFFRVDETGLHKIPNLDPNAAKIFAVYDVLNLTNKPEGDTPEARKERKAISEAIADIMRAFIKNPKLDIVKIKEHLYLRKVVIDELKKYLALTPRWFHDTGKTELKKIEVKKIIDGLSQYDIANLTKEKIQEIIKPLIANKELNESRLGAILKNVQYIIEHDGESPPRKNPKVSHEVFSRGLAL